MAYDPQKHHRSSIRLPGYDYSQEGAYFVTVCVKHKEKLFGIISDDCMSSNDVGNMIDVWWKKIPEKFPGVVVDEYVIMPNHIHGIIHIIDSQGGHMGLNRGGHMGPPLHKMIQWFKTMTTNEYIRNVKQKGWPPFDGTMWQRDYYEHIVRNDRDMYRIREYIRLNVQNWRSDDLHII